MRNSSSSSCFHGWILIIAFTSLSFFQGILCEEEEEPPHHLGSSRVVFQTNYGDIEFGFYPSVAPKTVDHIFKLVRLGGYNTNHFFRVDKGFVAQVADVANGRSAPMSQEQKEEAKKTVVGEFSKVKHVRGILSMGRYSDPNSGSSSFSMLLGDAPHLDGQYAIFGKVTKGDETLRKLEELPTRREGIFVMPVERITILSTYYYDQFSMVGIIESALALLIISIGLTLPGTLLCLEKCAKSIKWAPSNTKTQTCEEERSVLKRRLAASAIEVERQRMKCLP